MISNLKVNERYELDLAVKKSEIKLTRTNKPYLWLQLTDGKSDITANVWDWPHVNAPEINTILHLEGTVDSYNEQKQLKVNHIERCTTKDISDFLPKSDIDPEVLKCELRRLIDSIECATYKSIVEECITPEFYDVPGAISIHHAYKHGLLEHSVSVGLVAEAIVDSMKYKTAPIDRSLVIAGALLHDIGKVSCFTIDGLNVKYTIEGTLMDHIVLGNAIVGEYWKHSPKEVDRLIHIISSHHGTLEFGSPVTPKFLEAYIVHWADNIDSRYKIICDANADLTTEVSEKVWALNTRLLSQWEV